jgi:hypothetical protein
MPFVSRLYDRRVALLASLFSALTVMQIQQSHFFTTDLFVNPFAFLAIYFAVEIMLWKDQRLETRGLPADSTSSLQSPVADLHSPASDLNTPSTTPDNLVSNLQSPFSKSNSALYSLLLYSS